MSIDSFHWDWLGQLDNRKFVFTNEHFVAPESRSAKNLIEIDLKWMLTGKEKSSIDVPELWEKHECELSNHMAPTVLDTFLFRLLGPSSRIVCRILSLIILH